MSWLSFFDKDCYDREEKHISLGIEKVDDNSAWKNKVIFSISNDYSQTCDKVELTREERLALIEYLKIPEG